MTYTIVPWGERVVIIHEGFQLADFQTEDEAKAFIQIHKKNPRCRIPKSSSKKPKRLKFK
jgi:hypothetical protein